MCMASLSTSGNGGVSVTVGGDFTVRNVSIAPEMLEDKDYLERELVTAFDGALTSARAAMQDQMKSIGGSLGIDMPGF